MRVLLDECLPRTLKREIVGHDVITVPEAGWAGKKNGELLRLAAAEYDVFVTMDQGLPFQQNLAAAAQEGRFSVLILEAPSNRLEALLPLVPALHEALRRAGSGGVVRVTTGDRR